MIYQPFIMFIWDGAFVCPRKWDLYTRVNLRPLNNVAWLLFRVIYHRILWDVLTPVFPCWAFVTACRVTCGAYGLRSSPWRHLTDPLCSFPSMLWGRVRPPAQSDCLETEKASDAQRGSFCSLESMLFSSLYLLFFPLSLVSTKTLLKRTERVSAYAQTRPRYNDSIT